MSILRQQKGGTMVVVAGGLLTLLILTAMLIGLGNLYANTSQLQGLVDAASVAGAQGLRTWDKAAEVSAQYAKDNGILNDTGTAAIGNKQPIIWTVSTSNHAINWTDWMNMVAGIHWTDWTSTAVACYAPPNTINNITVTAKRTINFPMPQVLGLNSKTITASSTSALIAADSVRGSLRPWGMWKSSLPRNPAGNIDLNMLNTSHWPDNKVGAYGNEYTIAVNGTTNNGNFIAVDLPTAAAYADNIRTGYKGTVKIGDMITADTGEMGTGGTIAISNFLQGTYYNIDDPDPRRVIGIPIIDGIAPNVEVVGFAAFLVHQVNDGSVTANILQVVMKEGIIYGFAPTSSGITRAVIIK